MFIQKPNIKLQIAMNRICYIILCAVVLLSSCRREDQSARLLDEYQKLNERVSAQLNEVESPEVADSLVEVFVSEALALQQAQPESEAAYVILEDIYFLLDVDRKQQAFAVLNLDSLAAHGLQRHYDAFLAEQRTAAGLGYSDFNAVLPNGDAVSLSDYVGKSDYLLVDFWASWCGPCRRSMSGLKELLAEHADRLAIVGVSVDESEEAWLKAVDDLGLTWPQLRDSNGEGASAYGITSIPHTVLIGRDGTIIAHNPEHEEIGGTIEK